ncbi:hypothetical protein ANTQUA_LOCUS1784 [Anthophora quadrimaculata]
MGHRSRVHQARTLPRADRRRRPRRLDKSGSPSSSSTIATTATTVTTTTTTIIITTTSSHVFPYLHCTRFASLGPPAPSSQRESSLLPLAKLENDETTRKRRRLNAVRWRKRKAAAFR